MTRETSTEDDYFIQRIVIINYISNIQLRKLIEIFLCIFMNRQKWDVWCMWQMCDSGDLIEKCTCKKDDRLI